MNLTRALEVALPEIPARTVTQHYPRLDPGTTFREHIEDGKPMVRIYVPSVGGMYTLPPKYWQLAQLFDGKRSYEDIATLYSQQAGAQYDANEVRDFAGEMESGDFRSEYWQLAQLFDGKRSYEDIATLYSQQAGAQYDANEVRDFAGEMESGDF